MIHCSTCGKNVLEGSLFCSECGASIHNDVAYCKRCGTKITDGSVYCNKCGINLFHAYPKPPIDSSLAWILLIFFGGWGVHRFYLGGRHIGWGVAYLLTGAFCGIGWIVDLCYFSSWLEEYNNEVR